MKLSDKAQASLDKVIEKFQKGDLGAIVKAITISLPEDAPARNWTLNNRVLAFAQTGNLDCRGYRQWQAYGRNVKKGSYAGFILSPRHVKKTKKNSNGEEEAYQQLIGWAAIPVFSPDDTEGDTPLPDYIPVELPPLMDVAEKLGIEVNYQPLPPDRLGDYSPDSDKIRLGTDSPATFFHELAHAAHKRTNGNLKNGQNDHQETVAELTAAVLMELYGYDHSGNAWRYIAGYNKDPLTAIMKAISEVGKVLEIILE